MKQYVDKAAVVAEIENLLDKGKYHEEYDCVYRDGNNGALYALKDKLDTIEVKDIDSTDAFIEKACEFLSKPSNYNEGFIYPSHSGVIDSFVNNFKNYMKGE